MHSEPGMLNTCNGLEACAAAGTIAFMQARLAFNLAL